MNGGVKFEDALDARLKLIKPTSKMMKEMDVLRPSVLSPGVEELVKVLQARKVDVYLVSGGMRDVRRSHLLPCCVDVLIVLVVASPHFPGRPSLVQLILPVAMRLNIPATRIIANILFFDKDGNYTGFDKTVPTSRDGGKAEAVHHLKKQHGYAPIIMIGDGATDMQVRSSCMCVCTRACVRSTGSR